VIPFYEEHDIRLQRVLTDRETEYCGTHDRLEYECQSACKICTPKHTKIPSADEADSAQAF
jgi:hypothetical protein